MKIKQDYVTNSSSTSFIFMTKSNNINDLYKEIIKNKKSFNLFKCGYKITATDLCLELEDQFQANNNFDHSNNIVDINDLFSGYRRNLLIIPNHIKYDGVSILIQLSKLKRNGFKFGFYFMFGDDSGGEDSKVSMAIYRYASELGKFESEGLSIIC